MLDELHWPFEAIRDREGATSGWVALHGPIVSPAQHAQFAALRRLGTRFVGVCSYLDFPHGSAKDGLDYESVCEAWCHCFRDPNAKFTQALPRALISASDFTDSAQIERVSNHAVGSNLADVIYVGAVEPWQQPVKNWALAACCVPLLWHRLGLRTLVIGRPDTSFPVQDGVRFVPWLPWPALLAALAQARLLFAPNALDPSPRIVAEALCLDVPLLVYREILGGWKYVNPFTGVFFDGESDVVEAASLLLCSAVEPREWFRANHGPEPASQRLGTLLRATDPAVDPHWGWRITAAGPDRRQVG